MNLPAISVVIPMYNMEKFIGECLDSLFAQTFTDFEVIVVDDCSTDNSAAIVESYTPKFGGRLKLLKLKKNSGGAPAPRNRGIKFALGEYFFFMDSDDALMPNGLKVMYSAAKNFNADIVHCEKWYSAHGDTISTNKNLLKINTGNRIDTINSPIFDTQNLKERVTKLTQNRFWWAPWSHLIRREFILENDLEFPKLNIADDLLFTIFAYCLAEKVVIIPDVLYVWRTLDNSNSRANQTNTQVEKFIHRRVNDTFLGIQILDDFTKNFELFQTEPAYKYALFDFFVRNQIWNLHVLYSQNPAMKFDHLIRKEFVAIGNDPIVAAFLFDKMMTLFVTSILNNNALINKFNQFAAQAQARIAQLEAENKNLRISVHKRLSKV